MFENDVEVLGCPYEDKRSEYGVESEVSQRTWVSVWSAEGFRRLPESILNSKFFEPGQ